MNAVTRRTATVLALALVVLSAASLMAAPPHPTVAPLRLNPYTPDYPRLGFLYRVIPGYGYEILSVSWGSPASRIGLEPGDVVRSINGYPLTYYGAHHQAVAQAMNYGGWLSMRIRDVRTGYTVTRGTYLYGVGAPAAAAMVRN